jgi:hypothetical protein
MVGEFMNAQIQARQDRTQYRFALVGLSANDARHFSSLFRLLSARMHHIWLPVAPHEIRALTLVGDAATIEEIDTARMHGDILHIGNHAQDRVRALCFPLRPTDIMNAFDRIGDARDREAGRVAASSPTPRAPTAPQATSALPPIPSSVRAALAASADFTLSINADGRVMQTPRASGVVTGATAAIASDTAVVTRATATALSATNGAKLLR